MESVSNIFVGNLTPADTDEADVYINWGCDQSGCRSEDILTAYGVLGMGLSKSQTLGVTSMLAPIALAQFIHLRNQLFSDEPFNDALIQTIVDHWIPNTCNDGEYDEMVSCIFQDPLINTPLRL